MARPIAESTDVQSAHDHPWRSVWMSRRDRAHLRYMLGHDPDPHAREWARDVLDRMAAAPDWPMPNPPPFPPADDESRPTPTSREPTPRRAASMSAVWFIGPESGIYHTRRTCPSLSNTRRYWHIDSAPSVDDLPPSDGYRNRGRERTLCKVCAKWDASLAVPGVEAVR